MDYQPEPSPRPAFFQAMRDRVSMPGIFLAVVGVLNLVIAGVLIVQSVQLQKIPVAEFEKAIEQGQKDWNEQQKEGWKELQRQGWTPAKLQDAMIKGGLAWGAVAALVGFLGLLGGIRMAGLRSYGLAILAAVLTAIPVLSPCCLLGQVVGIWALIVLLNSDVHAAFKTRANRLPPDEGMMR